MKVLFGVAVALHVFVIAVPVRRVFGLFQWGLFDPFTFNPQQPVFVIAATALGVAGVLVAGRRSTLLSRHHGLTLLGLVLLGTSVKGLLILAHGEGLDRYRFRTVGSGHGEFPLEAAAVEDLRHALRSYEYFVRDDPDASRRPYSMTKGPGVLAFHGFLHWAANTDVGRSILGPWATDSSFREGLGRWLSQRHPALTPVLSDAQREELAYALTLIVFVFPVLTYLTLIPLYYLASELASPLEARYACLAYICIPGVTLMIGHLDFALFPLLFSGAVAAFIVGYRRESIPLLGLGAVFFVALLTLTMAALAVIGFAGAYLGLHAHRRWRSGEPLVDVGLRVARPIAIVALTVVALLGVLHVVLDFDPVARFAHARAVNAQWGRERAGVFWIVLNSMEFALALTLGFVALALARVVITRRSTIDVQGRPVDIFVQAWFFTMVALLLLGGQHGETNRVWAFMYAPSAVVVAYSISLWFNGRARLPLLLSLGVLVLSRYVLTYS